MQVPVQRRVARFLAAPPHAQDERQQPGEVPPAQPLQTTGEAGKVSATVGLDMSRTRLGWFRREGGCRCRYQCRDRWLAFWQRHRTRRIRHNNPARCRPLRLITVAVLPFPFERHWHGLWCFFQLVDLLGFDPVSRRAGNWCRRTGQKLYHSSSPGFQSCNPGFAWCNPGFS
jgi:hypothetical protein